MRQKLLAFLAAFALVFTGAASTELGAAEASFAAGEYQTALAEAMSGSF